MRHTRVALFPLLFLCLIALTTGCGSTSSGGTTNGSFDLSADASVTIAQGQTRTFTVTPSGSSGFTGSIQVSVSGMPAGVTMSPATATVTSGASTTFTMRRSVRATWWCRVYPDS
jgi:hypothetical protein